MPYYNQFQKQILIENNQIFKIDQYLPIIIEAHGATNPAAGVMATNPDTTPEQNPRLLHLPVFNLSKIHQLKPAVDAARVVTSVFIL